MKTPRELPHSPSEEKVVRSFEFEADILIIRLGDGEIGRVAIRWGVDLISGWIN